MIILTNKIIEEDIIKGDEKKVVSYLENFNLEHFLWEMNWIVDLEVNDTKILNSVMTYDKIDCFRHVDSFI